MYVGLFLDICAEGHIQLRDCKVKDLQQSGALLDSTYNAEYSLDTAPTQ